MAASGQIKYISNPAASVRGPRGFSLGPYEIERAIHRTRTIVHKLSQFEVDVFALLGMRNLSAFVGEIFAAAMILEHPERLRKNPHQDGYPDLLVLDKEGSDEWNRLAGRAREKSPFSPFSTGGFEVKATCGAVPTPAQCLKRGFEKPDMGDQRVHVLTGYDWKAHHRETNHLFGLFWDFVDRCPTIVAVFYAANLEQSDWGKIVQPVEGGGRTTSVSMMNRGGVKKMYDGWVTVADSEPHARFFDERNESDLLVQALSAARKN